MTAKRIMIGFLGLLLTLFSTFALAQTLTTGDITGTVTDASGAVVPNAAVTLKSNAEGNVQNGQSNAAGIFRFALLKPGPYTLTVKAPGMSTSETQVTCSVGQITNVPVKVSVGGTATTIEVTAAQPLLSTQDANLTTGYSLQQITSLPTLGNDITSYAYSSPGVVMNTGSGYGNFSAYGLPSTSNLFTTNGNDNMDPYLNLNNSGASNLALGANELQEVAVVNNGYTVEYGRQAGTQMNATTKSGTNAYHGNAVYWWNGDTLNSNDWFGVNSGTPRPFANNNQYAASFGGPIKKDKLFFFADFEGLRYVLPGAGGAIYVPTPQFANTVGGINGTANTMTPGSAPFYQNIFNLYANAPGANRATPLTPADDANLGCGLASQANGMGGGLPGFGALTLDAKGNPTSWGIPCAQQFRSTQNNLNTEWLLNVRGDWNITNSDKFNMRFKTDHGIQATGTDPINAAFDANSVQPEWEGQINETHVFSPNMVNNFILSGMWYSAIFGPANFGQAIKTFPTELSFNDGAPFTTLGGGDYAYPQGRIVTQYMFTDDLSWTRGRHDLKFGFNFRRNLVSDYANEAGISGLYILGSMLDFANGVFDNANSGSTYQQNVPKVAAVQVKLYNLGIFAQDQWKATPKLNITYGLRLDITGNPGCKPNCYNRLDNSFNNLVHDPTVPYNQVIQTNLNQAYQSIQPVSWGPRVGLAYNLYPNTVIRGGIGAFSDMFPGTIVDRFLANAPNVYAASPSNTGPISFDVAGNPRQQAFTSAATFQNGFASGATLAGLQALLPGFGAPNYSNMGTKIMLPNFLEWNAQIEQQLSNRYIVSLNYVGNHGYNDFSVDPWTNSYCSKNCNPDGTFGTASQGILPAFQLYNGVKSGPDPRFKEVNSIYNQGWTNYDGLTATFKMRYSTFQAQFNYTWSHAFDTCSNDCLLPFTANTVVSLRYTTSPLLPGNSYGAADYDVRNAFTANYVWSPKSPWSGKAANYALGGWVIAGTIYYHGGYPWNAVASGVRGNLGNVTGLRTATPLGTFLGGGLNLGNCSDPSINCQNQNQFASPANSQTFGDLSRNSLRAASYFDTDLNVTKNFKITERVNFAVGANFFNLFNHPNFDLPNNNVSSGNFGTITQTVEPATTPYGAFAGVTLSGRIVQINGRLTF